MDGDGSVPPFSQHSSPSPTALPAGLAGAPPRAPHYHSHACPASSVGRSGRPYPWGFFASPWGAVPQTEERPPRGRWDGAFGSWEGISALQIPLPAPPANAPLLSPGPAVRSVGLPRSYALTRVAIIQRLFPKYPGGSRVSEGLKGGEERSMAPGEGTGGEDRGYSHPADSR